MRYEEEDGHTMMGSLLFRTNAFCIGFCLQDEHDKALAMYLRGVEYLMTGLKYEKNERYVVVDEQMAIND